ncbi:MAG: hypothetical protein ABR910_10870 [Acidobacteriaceae bacterium]|jgi:hypothetical protein
MNRGWVNGKGEKQVPFGDDKQETHLSARCGVVGLRYGFVRSQGALAAMEFLETNE